MKTIVLLAAGVIVASLSLGGCTSSYYGQYETIEPAEADTLAMTPDDVIALSRDGVTDEVIINQIKATRSSFRLTTNEIIELKQAGVSERVLNAMINTTRPPRVRRVLRPYPYAYGSYYPYAFGYPWYSSWYFGFGYPYRYGHYFPYYPHVGYGGHYGGYFGGHYVGGGFGGHRSFGMHR